VQGAGGLRCESGLRWAGDFMPHGSWLLASHVHLCLSSTSSMFVILSVSLPILLRNARNQKKKSIKIQLSSKLSPIRHSKHQSSPARLRIKVPDIKVTPAHHDRPLPPPVHATGMGRLRHRGGSITSAWELGRIDRVCKPDRLINLDAGETLLLSSIGSAWRL
jgi:hypothetical protein